MCKVMAKLGDEILIIKYWINFQEFSLMKIILVFFQPTNCDIFSGMSFRVKTGLNKNFKIIFLFRNIIYINGYRRIA